MTSHITNDELLWDYLHELLDPAQVNEFEAHLAGCNACQQALEIARADCAQLAAATRLDGPFPLFEAPDELAPASERARLLQALRCRSRAAFKPIRKIQARKFCTSPSPSRARQHLMKASWATSWASS